MALKGSRGGIFLENSKGFRLQNIDWNGLAIF